MPLDKANHKNPSVPVVETQTEAPSPGQARVPDGRALGRWRQAIARSSQDPLPARQIAFSTGTVAQRSDLTEIDARQTRADANGTHMGRVPVAPAPTRNPDHEVGLVLPLSALRSRHAGHQDASSPQAVAGVSQSEGSASPPVGDAIAAAEWLKSSLASPMPTVELASPEASRADASVERLQALIEACCERLWVSDATPGSPRAVMLDLGLWISGCTVELARTAGVLKLTLRGVEGRRGQHLDGELEQLAEVLANKLDCQVVTAVVTDQESM